MNEIRRASQLLLTLLTACAVLAGCGTTQTGWNHFQLRKVSMEYMEDQIIDNVIRAKNRYPILHLDLNSIGSVVDSNIGGTAAGGQSIVNQGLAAASTVTRPLTFSVLPQRNNKVSVTVSPVLNANEVYAAYEAFVDIEGSVRSDAPPNRSAVHIGKRWHDGRYYWVPKEFAEEFFQLSLRAGVKRGTLQAASTAPKTSRKPQSLPAKARRKPIPEALQSPDVTPNAVKMLDSGEMREQTRELQRLRLELE